MSARIRDDYFQERVVIGPFTHAEVTASATYKIWEVPAGKKFRLDRAVYLNVTGLAEDTTNVFAVRLLKGTTVMASWSTDSDLLAASASIPANAFLALTLSATDGDRVADAGDDISLDLVEGGTATLPAGQIYFEGRLL